MQRTSHHLWRFLLRCALILAVLCMPVSALEIQTNIGSYEATQTLDATSQINCGTAVRHRTVPVQGNAAPVDLTSNPQIIAGTNAGQRCTICGAHATDTVELDDGTGLALSFVGGSLVLKGPEAANPGICVDFVWTGSLWRQLHAPRDIGEGYAITPPADQDMSVTTSGSGEFTYDHQGAGAQRVARFPEVTLPNAFTNTTETASRRRISGLDSTEQLCLEGPGGTPLKLCFYEQGGVFKWEVTDNSHVEVAVHRNISAGLTHKIQGDSIDIVTYDGTAATQTHHKAPVFDDGLKVTFNPNATNAGLNVGAQAGDPSTPANGDVWYDSTSNKFRCRENAATVDCVGAGGGAPTGATYITQTADGTLSAEQALSSLATGYMKVTTGTGVVSSQATPIPAGDGGTGNAFFAVSGPTTSTKTFTFPDASAAVLTDNADVTVAQGGTGISSGTSGGIPYFSGTTTIASSGALTANAVVLGGGAGVAPTVVSGLGTSGQVLTSNGAAAAPTWQAAAGSGSVQPIRPYSTIPITAGSVFGCIIGDDEMLCVADATTLTADATWRLGFEMPPTLATGCTYKLQVDVKANAATGVARLNPKWNTWAVGVTRASLSLNAETVTPDSVTGAAGSGDTVTFGTGDENQLIRIKWTLNASTVTAAQRIAMDLVAEDASYTLATQLGMLPSIICE